jgi:hypothetical protein
MGNLQRRNTGGGVCASRARPGSSTEFTRSGSQTPVSTRTGSLLSPRRLANRIHHTPLDLLRQYLCTRWGAPVGVAGTRGTTPAVLSELLARPSQSGDEYVCDPIALAVWNTYTLAIGR